jgi:hypothetical protein
MHAVMKVKHSLSRAVPERSSSKHDSGLARRHFLRPTTRPGLSGVVNNRACPNGSSDHNLTDDGRVLSRWSRGHRSGQRTRSAEARRGRTARSAACRPARLIENGVAAGDDAGVVAIARPHVLVRLEQRVAYSGDLLLMDVWRCMDCDQHRRRTTTIINRARLLLPTQPTAPCRL